VEQNVDPKEYRKATIERYERRNVLQEVLWKVQMDSLRKQGEEILRSSDRMRRKRKAMLRNVE